MQSFLCAKILYFYPAFIVDFIFLSCFTVNYSVLIDVVTNHPTFILPPPIIQEDQFEDKCSI